jgi:hypothetical protein
MGWVVQLVETGTDRSRARGVDVLEISQALPASNGPAGHIAPVHIPPISGQSRLACEPGCRSRENVALQPQLLVLAPQPSQLVTFSRREPVTLLLPATLLPVGLRNPLAD